MYCNISKDIQYSLVTPLHILVPKGTFIYQKIGKTLLTSQIWDYDLSPVKNYLILSSGEKNKHFSLKSKLSLRFKKLVEFFLCQFFLLSIKCIFGDQRVNHNSQN